MHPVIDSQHFHVDWIDSFVQNPAYARLATDRR